jgi:ATP-dependent Zn protease
MCGYAAAVAKAHERHELTPDLYLAGVWVAYRTGALKENLTLSAHLAEHARYIELLMDQCGWDKLDQIMSPADESMPYAASLDEAIQKAVDKEQPLMALINGPVTSAVKLGGKISTAYHEAGHAIVSLVLRPNVRIVKATIKPEGDSSGHVRYDETSPYYQTSTTLEDFRENLCVLMAGRAAQVLKFGLDAASSGAISDFANATQSAWQAITTLGLDDDFGPVVLPALKQDEKFPVSSGWLFDEAQRRLQQVLKESYKLTQQILKDNEKMLDQLAFLLMERETVSEEEIRKELILAL